MKEHDIDMMESIVTNLEVKEAVQDSEQSISQQMV
jgi:hypothetical protein